MTEVLFAVGAGQEVVGVSQPASFPPEAAACPAVASWERVDVERVLSLAPTGCFTVEGMTGAESIGALRRLGVPVHIYPMRSLTDLWMCFEAVGQTTGHGPEAASVLADLKSRVAKAGEGSLSPPRRALVVVGLDPLVSVGAKSFLDDVLRLAGYTNALGGRGEAYPAISMEAAATASPEVVVFPEGELDPKAMDRFESELRHLVGHPVSRVSVPADPLVRPGPRTVEAIERLAKARR